MTAQGLFRDERGAWSSARIGVWVTVLLAAITILIDIWLTVRHPDGARVPNTAYALLATMFTAFVSWAAGPRIAQYLAPQAGGIASGLAAAARDVRLPSRKDDERHDGGTP